MCVGQGQKTIARFNYYLKHNSGNINILRYFYRGKIGLRKSCFSRGQQYQPIQLFCDTEGQKNHPWAISVDFNILDLLLHLKLN